MPKEVKSVSAGAEVMPNEADKLRPIVVTGVAHPTNTQAADGATPKPWTAIMTQVHPCGHTEAQHQYYAEKTLNLDMSSCPAALAEARAEVEKLRKALNSIKCEVVGWLSLARPMLVQELSVTNVRVMEHHVAESERLLAGERKDGD
jgi:hypothetical protein